MYQKILNARLSIFMILMVLAMFYSCNDSDKTEEAIAALEVEVNIERFDRMFAEAQPEDISSLKRRFPYLFPEQYADSIWENKLKDTLQIELLGEVDKTFGSFEDQTEELKYLFQHISYYFPAYKIPKVVTLTSDVQYENRVILTDSLLLIGLDNYLGKEHKYYNDIQKYIKSGLDKDYLASDIASAFAKKVVLQPQNRDFMARMIYYGKELFLKEKLLASYEDHIVINYTAEALDWARANEEQIWRNFIENEYLFSTDSKLARRFLDPAPFSKFGLELDNESPGR